MKASLILISRLRTIYRNRYRKDYADLAGDEQWRKLTMRILLSHTAGFSNFRFYEHCGDYDPDGKLAIYFEPGTRYAYSGEGFLLAQRVLEWGLDGASSKRPSVTLSSKKVTMTAPPIMRFASSRKRPAS